MLTCTGFAATTADQPLAPFTFNRRDVGPDDVQIEIAYCGVCHSDLHTARNEWQNTVFPVVPGHEIVGHVTAVGANVTGFKVGDTAGVGCLVGSCQTCSSCKEGLEQYCDNGFVGTYNGPEKVIGGMTFGGWIWPVPHLCSVPASPPIRRCAIGVLVRARKLASSASAGLAIWR